MPAAATLTSFLERAGQLYSLPSVAIEVLELTAQPKVDVPELKRCIENDPALTAKILRVVNSSLFGLSREVSDLNQALALLGIKPLKLLVLGFSLSHAANKQPMGAAMQGYWRRTLTLAVAARELAARVYRKSGDEPFIAALLQDLGELVLLQELGEPYAQLITRAKERGASVSEVEERVLGFTHAALTVELLEAWKLPPAIVHAIGAASDETKRNSVEGAELRLSQIVRSAGLLVDVLLDQQETALTELVESTTGAMPLSAGLLGDLVTTLQDKVAELADVFSVPLPSGTDYKDVLLRAQQQLSLVAGEVAGDLLRQRPDTAEMTLWQETQETQRAMRDFLRQADPEALSEGHSTYTQTRSAASTSAARPSATILAPVKRQSRECSTELLQRLAAAVSSCRQQRCPLTLALVELDGFQELASAAGPLAAERLVGRLRRICQEFGGSVVSTCEAQHAVIWANCDRSQAARLANELLRRAVHDLGAHHDDALGPIVISIGVATVALPPKNFPPGELADTAARCLSTAQLSGGNTVKSIGVY